jgi:lipoprotein-anchoring transpeptidase ErfK/SrfK
MSTFEAASDANLKPRDRAMLAQASYRTGFIPFEYRRSIVSYHRREAPGSIVVDTDARFLYYVLPQGKAIRYGVTVGEDALAFSGVAKVGAKQEWPAWTPTAATPPGADNPMGARALYIHQGSRDTLYRIHGTNQPEYIGQAISSGCIRMTNEDVIDLYNRAKLGAPVVVLAQSNGDSPFRPRMASGGEEPQRDFRGE